jgi:peroxiredoxin
VLQPLPGDAAPNFSLSDLNGGRHQLSDYLDDSSVVVLEWLNPQCPYVQKFHGRADFMNRTADVFSGENVVWLGIDSSAPGQEGSDRRDIRQFVRDYDVAAPVLLDRSGHVGRLYGIRYTPTMVVIAPDGSVVYRGAPDASSALDREPEGKNYVKAAVEAALVGQQPKFSETAAYGCRVRYAAPRLTASAATAQF